MNLSERIHLLSESGGSRHFDAVISLIAGASEADLAALAGKLGRSGESVDVGDTAIGFASTGGASSLSTLLVPLLLSSAGLRVPSVAVPGRPAGAVDVLATLPGYKTDLNATEITRALAKSSIVFCLAGSHFAPLDASFFAHRQYVGAQQNAALVIASVLAKKVAVGIRRLGIEVRVSPGGNFGTTTANARRNARRLLSVASLLGIRCTCFLTDNSHPYQPFIGRGESLLALNALFEGSAGKQLNSHLDLCWRIASSLLGSQCPASAPAPCELRDSLWRNLDAQGSSPAAFLDRVQEIRAAPHRTIEARQEGFLSLDLDRLREILVRAQKAEGPEGKGTYPDPLGLQLLARPGDLVRVGDAIARVRLSRRKHHESSEIDSCFAVLNQPSGAGASNALEILAT